MDLNEFDAESDVAFRVVLKVLSGRKNFFCPQ